MIKLIIASFYIWTITEKKVLVFPFLCTNEFFVKNFIHSNIVLIIFGLRVRVIEMDELLIHVEYIVYKLVLEIDF